MTFEESLADELTQLQADGRFRAVRPISMIDGRKVNFEGVPLLNFASNDYLGVAGNTALREEFFTYLVQHRGEADLLSAASARLLSGNFAGYAVLENTLEKIYPGRRVLAVNSGYHANIGVLPALSGSKDLILADKLNHASMIDGLQLCSAEFRRYRHLDYADLEKRLVQAAESGEFKNIFIVSESIFSMDGDTVDLRRLVELKKRYNAILVIDESHGCGVRGALGGGVAEEQSALNEVDVIVGTLGKAFGSYGAYIVSSEIIRNYLINKMRSFIFTTALPPIITYWSAFTVEKVSAMRAERAHLQQLGNILRQAAKEANLKYLGDSQIVPVVIGESLAAMEFSARLKDAGVLAMAARPPTVPAGSARIRFSLSAALTAEDVKFTGELLKQYSAK